MRRRLVVLTIATAVSVTVPSATAVQFVPKMNKPESFKDVLFGLKETRDNIAAVQCGGWNELSDGTAIIDPTKQSCRPVISCVGGINACNGMSGYTSKKNPDGSVPVCLSNLDAAGGQWDYLLMHELVHVKQFCGKAPGEPLATSRSECCQVEKQAHAVNCSAEAADGLFDAPINGITLTRSSCIEIGANMSCKDYGENACSSINYPPEYEAAFLAAMTNSPRTSCADLVNNPPPRVQSLLDDIKEISDANAGEVLGNVPLPDITHDVPGHDNIRPLGKAATGMGERGAFEFPDSAFGYNSACILYDTTIVDPDLARLGMNIVYDDVGVDEDPRVRTEPGNGTIYINPYGWCTRRGDLRPGKEDEYMEKATPRWCEKLFRVWQQASGLADIHPTPNPLCPEPPKQYCFDPAYTKICTGQECRTTNGPDFGNKMTECHADPDNPTGPPIIDVAGYQYASLSTFYRHYSNPFGNWSETRNPDQSPLTVRTPGKDWKLRAECYEYYKEEDPKDIVMGPDREQCEIIILTQQESDPDKPEWVDTENEKQKDKTQADRVVVEEATRDPRSISDPWVPDSKTNLSILNIEKLRASQENLEDPTDITGVMSTILETKQRGSKTVPDHARTDTFSDDDHRAFPEFWEAQQAELQKMVRDPTTKLVMPARFLVGLADDDPLYQYVRGIVSHSDGTVEMTLRAGPEDIGNVLESFARVAIGPIQEVRIPIVVPLVSENEIDLLIFQWHQWKEYTLVKAEAARKASESEVDPAKQTALLTESSRLRTIAGNADPLVARLESYKTDAKDVRRLRNALVQSLTKLFEPQKKIRRYVADWYEQNSALLQKSASGAVQKRELKEIWRSVQQVMLETDEAQLNWCSNQRYSVPIYALLDAWWGDQPRGAARNHGYTPPGDLTSLGYTPPPDQQYDFSDMKFSSEPLLIPVLWPIQVSLKLPQPPPVGVEPQPASDFPDLPDLPNETIFDSFRPPEVELPPPILIEVPETEDLAEAITILEEFEVIVDGLKATYKRFQPSVLLLPDPEQKKGNPEKIIHIENELRERIARLFSRWLPERKVDMAGRTARIGNSKPACKEDVVCLFLPAERQVKTGWQWFVPESADDFTSFAENLKNDTLPFLGDADEVRNPYDAPTLPVLRRFFPRLTLPITIDLVPDSPVAP